MEKGLFITLEGIDGSGKSTQANALKKTLNKNGNIAILTREPGGSVGAELIRKLLVEGDPDRWSPETEMLLFTAARRDHFEKTIRPALEKGKIVISDRFADSTRVYQGATRGDLRALVDQLHQLMIGYEPDLTLIIDVDPQESLARGLARGSGEDRFEDFGLDFQKKLRQGFLKLGHDFDNRCKIIDGTRSVEDISSEILTLVYNKLND
ncbi:MAG: dTMP kinase [Paracoccaceae bacterium]